MSVCWPSTSSGRGSRKIDVYDDQSMTSTNTLGELDNPHIHNQLYPSSHDQLPFVLVQRSTSKHETCVGTRQEIDQDARYHMSPRKRRIFFAPPVVFCEVVELGSLKEVRKPAQSHINVEVTIKRILLIELEHTLKIQNFLTNRDVRSSYMYVSLI
ncbi:hypothetical protein ABKN59_001523 [Abortiporus biennis]